MFLLKKIVTPFFLPVSVCVEVLLLGLILLWFTRLQKTGKVIVTIGFIILTGLSYGPVSEALLRPLEYKYPPLLNSDHLTEVKWVVVLGGGHVSNPKIPVTSRISSSALYRLVEGIRHYRQRPGRKLILTGGVIFDPVSHAEVLSEVAQAIGVNKQDIVLEQHSMDTKDEALYVKAPHEATLRDLANTLGRQLDPEAIFLSACWMLHLGDRSRALEALQGAVDGGFSVPATLTRERLFEPLRGEPEFTAILEQAEREREKALALFREAGGDRLLGL